MTIRTDQAAHSPLVDDRDKIRRIRALLAPAGSDRQLWTMLLDSAGYQLPLVVPIADCPQVPDPAALDTLVAALEPELPQPCGGRLLFVFERLGPLGVTADDRCWAAAALGSCERAEIGYAGLFLLSPGGISKVVP